MPPDGTPVLTGEPLPLIATQDGLARRSVQLHTSDENAVRNALITLSSFTGPPLVPYHYYRDFIATRNALYLAPLFRSHYYLSKSIDRSLIQAVARDLTNRHGDPLAIRMALAKLWLTTKRQKIDTRERDTLLHTYAEHLAEYPAPMVQVVLSKLAMTQVFFPALAEIQAELDGFSTVRTFFINALRSAHQKLETPDEP